MNHKHNSETNQGAGPIRVEYMRGTGPGGQNKNKRNTACRVTCLVTGISAYACTRTQNTSYCMAMEELEKRIAEAKAAKKAAIRKAVRDEAIHNHKIVRTYNFPRGIVKDHRSGKTATIKEILDKGKLELLK